MAKYKKISIPHNVKERLRHRKIQSILEHVGKHVPKLPSDKKETKAKCLRRVVLYMKCLLQKLNEVKKSPTVKEEPRRVSKALQSKSKKVKEVSLKKLPVSKVKCRKAQIIFLKKFPGTSPEQQIVSSTTTSEPSTVGNQKIISSSSVDHDDVPTVTSYDHVFCKPFDTIDPENNKVRLPSMKALRYSLNNKSNKLTHIDFEKCKDNFDSYKSDASLLYPMINFLQAEPDDTVDTIFRTDSTKSKTNCTKKDIFKKSEISSMNANQNVYLSEPYKGKQHFSEVIGRQKNKSKRNVEPQRPSNNNEFFGKNTIFHNPSTSAFVPVPQKSTVHPTATDFKNTFSPSVRNNSNVQSDDLSSSIPSFFKDMNSSLCYNSFSEDQDPFLDDIFSSGESATITSSNEWISNDEIDCGSLTQSTTFESPKSFPEYSVSMSPEKNYETEDFISHDVSSYSNNISIFKNNNLNNPNSRYHELTTPSPENHTIFDKCDLNYYVPEIQDTTQHFSKPLSVSQSSISNDLLNFHSSAPEYYYLYPNNEDVLKYQSRELERIRKKESSVPSSTSVDFYENMESCNFFNYPKQSESSNCGLFKDVQIKQEIPETLPAEEISYSFNNLNNFSWYSKN